MLRTHTSVRLDIPTKMEYIKNENGRINMPYVMCMLHGRPAGQPEVTWTQP